MESEQVVKKSKSAWRMLFVGFLFGVLASFLALIVIAIKWGPRGESSEVDLYSGHVITYKFFLWKRSQILGPKLPHVRWAIEHQNPVRSWYILCSSMSRAGWFEPRIAADYTTRAYVYRIYSLQIPEEEKIKLLHQYHKDLDALKLKEQERLKSFGFMESFYMDWEQKLQKIKNDKK
jgi:hypothetical protein